VSSLTTDPNKTTSRITGSHTAEIPSLGTAKDASRSNRSSEIDHTHNPFSAVPKAVDTNRRDLIGIEHMPVELIRSLIERSNDHFAKLLTKTPLPAESLLKGRTVANLFFESSTRTRTSFELAEKRIGADYTSLTPAVSSLTKGESMLDTVRVLEAMKMDAIVVRHSSMGVPQFLAERLPAHVHVINAGDGAHEHPTQALLDGATMIEALGTLEGKHLAIVGDIRHSRVARSNMWLMKKLGARVTLVGPETLMPRNAAEVFGVEVQDSLDDVLGNADAIMLLRIQLERQGSGLFPTLEEFHHRYGITKARLGRNQPFILHPGPVNYGVEISSEVADSERSLILRQVKRGVAVRMAVLEWVFEK